MFPVGIKNSWKYEKDLIILNENMVSFSISHKDSYLGQLGYIL